MKDFLGRPQDPTYVMCIIFVFETSLVRPERKCLYLWYIKACAWYIHGILLFFVTDDEVRYASDNCSKHVKVSLQANEVSDMKVTVRSSNDNTDNFFFVIQKNTTVCFLLEWMCFYIMLLSDIGIMLNYPLLYTSTEVSVCTFTLSSKYGKIFGYCEIRDAI